MQPCMCVCIKLQQCCINMLTIVVIARLILSFIVINFAAAAISVVLPLDKVAVACSIFKSAVHFNVDVSAESDNNSSAHTNS